MIFSSTELRNISFCCIFAFLIYFPTDKINLIKQIRVDLVIHTLDGKTSGPPEAYLSPHNSNLSLYNDLNKKLGDDFSPEPLPSILSGT